MAYNDDPAVAEAKAKLKDLNDRHPSDYDGYSQLNSDTQSALAELGKALGTSPK